MVCYGVKVQKFFLKNLSSVEVVKTNNTFVFRPNNTFIHFKQHTLQANTPMVLRTIFSFYDTLGLIPTHTSALLRKCKIY